MVDVASSITSGYASAAPAARGNDRGDGGGRSLPVPQTESNLRTSTDSSSSTVTSRSKAPPAQTPAGPGINSPQGAPYISPVVSIDVRFDTAVLLLRNAEDGEIVEQIPSESALEMQRRLQNQEIARQNGLDYDRSGNDLGRSQGASGEASDGTRVSTLAGRDDSSRSGVSLSRASQAPDPASSPAEDTRNLRREPSPAAGSLASVQSLVAASQSTGKLGGTVNITA